MFYTSTVHNTRRRLPSDRTGNIEREYRNHGYKVDEALAPRGRMTFDKPFSIWVFVLLGIEGMKTFKANPYFV